MSPLNQTLESTQLPSIPVDTAIQTEYKQVLNSSQANHHAQKSPSHKAELPLPRHYKGASLKKKYIHMIRDGYKTDDGVIYKTFEGRINRRIFAANNIVAGSGMRFFYMRDAADDVHCTILAVRTFNTFRELLQCHGYQNLVPDAVSLEAAVKAYARIPGYPKKELESGVTSLQLRVDGYGPNGPACRTRSETAKPISKRHSNQGVDDPQGKNRAKRHKVH